MNATLPILTREQFFDWAEAQDPGYEFDGTTPVLMPSSPIKHCIIRQNLIHAIHDRLRGSLCQVFGLGVGLATVGDTVRYPDAMVTCTEAEGSARLVPGVLAVFEVINPGFEQVDRIEKRREYRAVKTIRHYVILECASIGLTVLTRGNGGDDWTATALGAGDVLQLPEIGIKVPVAEIYAEVDLPDAPGATKPALESPGAP